MTWATLCADYTTRERASRVKRNARQEHELRHAFPPNCGVSKHSSTDGCGFFRCPTCARNVNRDKWRY